MVENTWIQGSNRRRHVWGPGLGTEQGVVAGQKNKKVNVMRAGRWDGVHPATAESGGSVKYGIQSSLQLQVEPPGYLTRRDMVSTHLLIVLLEYSLFILVSFIFLDLTHP